MGEKAGERGRQSTFSDAARERIENIVRHLCPTSYLSVTCKQAITGKALLSTERLIDTFCNLESIDES